MTNKLLRNRIERKLIQYDFNPASIGIHYWVEAIVNYIGNEVDPTRMITTYCKIADKYNTTPSRVERAMRHCSEKARDTLAKEFNFNGKVNNTIILEFMRVLVI